MKTVQHKRGTAAILTANNPTIAAGEIVVETDTNRFKVGDGSTAWAALPYQGVSLSSGTLPDARLSSNIPTWPTVAALNNQPSSTLDVYPRGEASSASVVSTSGSVFFIFFTPPVTITVSAITIANGTGAGSGLTLCRMGLYTFDETTATLVARCASDTTLFTSAATAYQRSFATAGGFPSNYTLNAGARYGVGVITVGTTAPNLTGRASGPGLAGLTPRMNAVLAGQSDLATASGLGAGQAHIFARLS